MPRGRAAGRSDDPQVPPDPPELLQREVDLLERVGRHQAGAEPALRRRHGRRRHGVGEHSGVEQPPPHEEGLLERADQDRHDRGLRRPDVEAQASEPVVQPAGIGPEPVPPLGLVLEHLQRGEHAGGVGRGQRGGEDERPTVVAEVVDDAVGRRHEPADRGQRLGEGARDDVHLVRQPEVRRGAVAVRAQDAQGVRVVQRQRSVVAPRHPHQGRDVGDVAFHRVHAVHDNHGALAGPVALHAALEVGQVAVVEPFRLPVRQLGPIHDRRVVELVEVHHLAPADEPGDQAQIGRVSGREDETGLLAEELGESVLELLVQIERAVQKPAAGAARAIPAQRPRSCFEHLGMVRQAEVVVRPQHDPLLSVDDDDGVFRLGNRLEIRIQADRLQLMGFGEFAALVKKRDLLKLLSIHDASAGRGGEERASHRFVTERFKLVNAHE